MKRAWAALPWVALFAWAIATSFYKVSNYDIWVHLRVGTDVLLSGQVPHDNSYSWVAPLRPFVAHEWLSGLLFQVIAGPTEGRGLTVLRAWVTSLIVVCCALSLPGERRSRLPALAFTALTMVLVISRASVRPHLFSLLFAAMLMVGFAWWREHRRWRALLWVAPLSVLWANLHGAYLLAPALLLVLSAGVLGAALFPGLSPGDGERPWQVRHAAQPAVVALLCLLGALVNPYGFDLVQFSAQMAGGNEYIKIIIQEWLSPFHEDHRALLEPYLLLLYLALLWGAALLRRRQLSLPDVAVALATTFLAVRVIRFIPYFAIFSLPVASALWEDLLRERAGARVRRAQRWLPLFVPAVLALVLLVRGPSFRMGGAELDYGWGFYQPRAMPVVKHLHAVAYEGGVFNEYEDGGYLVYAGRGRFKPVIDARVDVFGAELTYEWVAARRDAQSLLPYLERHDVGAVLLAKARQNHEQHRRALLASGRWRVELDDDDYLLLMRQPGGAPQGS